MMIKLTREDEIADAKAGKFECDIYRDGEIYADALMLFTYRSTQIGHTAAHERTFEDLHNGD